MKRFRYIVLFLLSLSFCNSVNAQIKPDFIWGNASYFNLSVGDSLLYQNSTVKLLQIENHFNQIKIGKDTLWLKVSRRALPRITTGIRIFVADNKNVKELASNSEIHSLLKKDALICLSSFSEKLLDSNKYFFPISFNDGFLWSVEEDSHMFSLQAIENQNLKSHVGIDIDLHDAIGLEKHWIIAIENSTVVWVNEKKLSNDKRINTVLLQSESQPHIFYLYDLLNNKKTEVKSGDKLIRGEPIGNIWGDEIWGHLNLSVILSDTIPTLVSGFNNIVNFFPQLYELYFKQTYSFNKSFTKGVIYFGRRRDFNGNEKNLSSYEEYSGKGWNLGRWNVADRVEKATKGEFGNARLKKQLFVGSNASCINPNNYYDYEIKVSNGVYRIRAKLGDYELASYQKVMFEGIHANTYELDAGVLKWSSEKVVKIEDGRLTVRIYVDAAKNKPAGLSEIVFQKAY